MFPEITRDEVFRIETARLWLRWPTLADATALGEVMAANCRHAGSRMAHANPNAVETLIRQWRAEMEAGLGLHLAVVPKAEPRLPVGMAHLSATRPARFAPDASLGAIGAEALHALTGMAGLLGMGLTADLVPKSGVLLGGMVQPPPPSHVASLCG